MNESGQSDLFDSLLNEIVVYLSRPSVQLQILIGLLLLVAARLLTNRLGRQLTQPEVGAPQGQWRRYHLGRFLLYPAVAWILLFTSSFLLSWFGVRSGILAEFAYLTVLNGIYRFVLAVIAILGSPATVRRYQFILFTPAWIILVTLELLSFISDLTAIAAAPFTELFGNTVTIGAAFIATVGLYLWIVGIRAIEDALCFLLTTYGGAELGTTKASLTLVKYLFIIIGVGFALSRLQFDTTTIAAISGGLSVGVGFALSTILSNLFSGLILLFERSLRQGDVIEIDGELSIVEEVTMRAMRVRTLNNVEKIIPNSAFVTSAFTTYTGSDKRIRLQLPVGAAYEDDPQKVKQVLIAVAHNHPLVLADPEPQVRLKTFGDSSIDYYLNVWLSTPLFRPRVESDLNEAIYQAFANNGLTIPFPQRDLHIRSDARSNKPLIVD